MSKNRSRIIDWVEYVVLRYVEGLVRALPWRTARSMAGLIGDFIRLVDRSERKTNAAKNLKQAFPGMSEKEVRGVIRAVYRHLPRCVVDAVNFIRISGGGMEADYLEVDGLERLPPQNGETGVIFVTGHFGPWELLGTAASYIGRPVYSLARPLDNPLLRRYVRQLREATGQSILTKKGSMKKVLKLLRGGENIGFLIDQDARHRGVFVDFFGKPASTVTSPARLALRTGAPVAFVYALPLKGGDRFCVTLADLVWPRPDADPREEVYRITQRLTSDLERLIRRHPSQWLWLHRRWRTYPGKYEGQEPPPRRVAGQRQSAAGPEAASDRGRSRSAPG